MTKEDTIDQEQPPINITIAMVAANRPEELKKALESIKHLNIKNIPVILGDDSKDDLSEQLPKQILGNQIQYKHNKPPLGEIRNSNDVIGSAKTEWVCLFHDDDRLAPAFFDKALEIIAKDPEIDLAYTGRVIVNEVDVPITHHQIKSGKDYYIYKAKDILDNMLISKELPEYRVPINTPGLIFKKSIFDAIGGFSNTIDTHCDTDFLLKALAMSRKVLFINEPLYISKIWYGNSGRTSSSRRGVVFEAQKGVLDNFKEFIQNNNIVLGYPFEDVYKNFANKCVTINGPLGWIALRYEGNYINRAKCILRTAKGLVKLNPRTLLNPKLYIYTLGSIFIPYKVAHMIHKYVLPKYSEKN